MTDLSPSEKALVEAARELDEVYKSTLSGSPRYEQFERALRAYDPPKPKVPQIPAWEEIVKTAIDGNHAYGTKEAHGAAWVMFDGAGQVMWQHDYEAIRRATSKEAE